MTYQLEHEAKTFGDWAYLAIAKHSSKFLKHESGVLADTDPEELHQMRVGMRRLRSAIHGFNAALNLSENAQEKKVGKVAKTLGELRDIDVLEDSLKNQYYPNLPKKEQKSLDRALSKLAKRRKKAFKTVKKTLESQAYLQLKQALDEWLTHPSYQTISAISIQTILPDLLLPQVSQLMLHPGWVVGINFKEGEAIVDENLSSDDLESLLENEGLMLHDLRKEAKRTRYNMELFTQFYGDRYQDYLQDVKAMQSILGDIQDSFVLVEFLDDIFGDDIVEKMPSFVKSLKENRYRKWQEWITVQRKFLTDSTRKDFHTTILQPIVIKSEIENNQDGHQKAEETEDSQLIDTSSH